ncbi:head-tail connector protein [Senegalia sp. (in: firmicutes)]|uniref:head-tail connector protein n=1 Tax=Senegalia sp. (in: firmicutes) TaxID=1924098 RepID=UPI003F989629
MSIMTALLERVKKNLILDHNEDNDLILSLIGASISYAENYQKKPSGFYKENPMDPTTEQAVIMLSSHFYESRDGSTAGFFQDKVDASNQVWKVVNMLLHLNRDVVI